MSEHYYTEKPLSKEDITKIKIRLKHDSFELLSAAGLFSKDELDKATQLLIERAEIKGKKILDIGCGYGVIGIALLRDNLELNVTFSDINERAIKITKKNLDLHKLKAEVIKSNLFENIEEKYDHILSNPPYAAGRDVCFKLIEDAHNHLNEEGTLQIVARHNKGGKMFSKKIEEVFGNSKDVAKQSGFRIYQGIKQ
jgi:HemK-like putative methylase